MGLPDIQCITYPCAPQNMTPPILAATPYDVRALIIAPPTLPSSPSYTPGVGQPLPQTDTPIFTTSTDELDRYRLLFLVLGIFIGAIFLSR